LLQELNKICLLCILRSNVDHKTSDWIKRKVLLATLSPGS